MPNWLIKTEPSEWSWDDQVKAKTTAWSGVTNPQAQKFMREMRRGDRVLFYHTGGEKQVVGIAEVSKTAYPDPGDKAGKLVLVDVKAVKPVPRPVTLAAIKAEKSLAHLPLVKQPRLSVMPIDDAAWSKILDMGGVE